MESVFLPFLNNCKHKNYVMEGEFNTENAAEIPAETLFNILSTDENGLSSDEVISRLKKYGYNEIEEDRISLIHKLLGYFWGPIPFMIEAAAILSILVGDLGDFTIIMSLLFINATVGFYQEHEADDAIELLKEKMAISAYVFRDYKWMMINARDLVPGDIIWMRIGDVAPADLKLLSGDYLLLDESSLTGESLPVEKKSGDICYSGSIVQQGEMKGLVISTGTSTFFGRASELIKEAKTPSHLEKAVVKIGDYLIIISVLTVSVIFMVGLFRQEGLVQILTYSLILLVASIPVAQPAVLSVTMAVGARVLAHKNAIVSKLSSIEEMAGMDVLCSDKTGTITQNKITVREIQVYGDFQKSDVLLYGALASEEESPDPIDHAIFRCLKNVDDLKDFKTLEFIQFDPVSKKTSAWLEDSSGNRFQVAKGAPQAILAILSPDDKSAKKVNEKVDLWAEKGFRALAVGRGQDNHWELVGLLALYDPPRLDSAQTIKEAQTMGVEVKMVTGDHIAIARETAADVGLRKNIKLPDEFKDKPAHKAQRVVSEAHGFAQVFPEDKYHIVELLQKCGKIVGMTGDGVNDAPAIKKADVGIAVSGATDAAKSTADIVFTSPGLSVIIDAIHESHKIFLRMHSYSLYRVSETIRILIFTALTILIFQFYPLTPAMLVIIALLDDIPIMTIAYDHTEKVNQPQKWNMKVNLGMSTYLGIIGVFSSFILLYILIEWFHLSPGVIQSMIFLKLVLAGHLTMFATRVKGPFWSLRPKGIFFWSIILTDITATLFVISGIIMPIVSWELVAFIWLYVLVAFIAGDILKIRFYRFLERINLS